MKLVGEKALLPYIEPLDKIKQEKVGNLFRFFLQTLHYASALNDKKREKKDTKKKKIVRKILGGGVVILVGNKPCTAAVMKILCFSF